MKKFAMVVLAMTPCFAILPSQALEPWHDQSTQKLMKEKAAKKKAAMEQAAPYSAKKQDKATNK